MWPNYRLTGQIIVLLAIFDGLAGAQTRGGQIYQTNCARCHDAAAGGQRVPSRAALAQLPPATILSALNGGVMREQGSHLTADERNEVANWLSRAAPAAPPTEPAHCSAGTNPTAGGAGWTSWGAGPDNARYQTNSGLAAADVPRLKLKWAYGVPGGKMMRSQPVVYKGNIYFGAEDGSLVSLDAKTGCLRWSAHVKNVRSGLTVAGQALYFGDVTGTVHAFNLETGKELWSKKIGDHPAAMITGAPAYHDGRIYVPLSSYEEVAVLSPGYHCCSFRGSVSALDAASGNVIWQTHTIEDAPKSDGKTTGPSGAAIWSTPTLDPEHHALYVTTGDNYSGPASKTSDAVMAFDLQTGKRLWSKQVTENDIFNLVSRGPGGDFDFGAPAILTRLGGGKRALLLSQKAGIVYAVDPDAEGKLLWQARVGKGGALGGVEWGAASDGRVVYAPVSDVAIIYQAKLQAAYLDAKAGGGLAAIEVSTGKLLWKAPAANVCNAERLQCSPAQSAPATAIPGAVFSGSLDGHLRAYATKDGAVLWDFDTEKPFDTVNHAPGAGGSLDVAGAVIADGMVFAESGYSQYGGKAGNVLLAFGTE